MTQEEVAERINVTPRTVMNIENYTGNPKMETLFPLIRLLKIDAREIFNPELQREDPSIRQLRFLIEDCSAQEAAMLNPNHRGRVEHDPTARRAEALAKEEERIKKSLRPYWKGSRLCAFCVWLIC